MITLSNGVLMAQFSPIGASLMGLYHADFDHNLVLGFDDEDEYRRNRAYLGTVIGRLCNRLGGAAFDIGDGLVRVAANEGENQLHGGPIGWSHREWSHREWSHREWSHHEWTLADQATARQDRVTMTLVSPDGDQGFPGTVYAKVRYRLVGAALEVELTATCDQATPLAMTTHSYFCLGGKNAATQKLWINSVGYTPVDDQGIPTGEVEKQPPFFANLAEPLDLNFCIADAKNKKMHHHATLSDSCGLTMQLHSNQPGLQVYNAHAMTAEHGPGLTPFAGVALEPQLWPNAPNRPHFPNAVMRPGETYRHLTRYDFQRTVPQA